LAERIYWTEFGVGLAGLSQYTTVHSIPYPKPGTPNPVVKLYVSLIDSRNIQASTAPVPIPAFSSSPDDLIIGDVCWTQDSEIILVKTFNRVQDTEIVYSVNLTNTVRNLTALPVVRPIRYMHRPDGWVEKVFALTLKSCH
jgi:hypothetical protein